MEILFVVIMHVLYLTSHSLCNVEHETCSNICSDVDSFDIVLLERIYLPISNETNYTYIISLNTNSTSLKNNCINDILSTTIWIEILPSNCCTNEISNTNMIEYGWKFEIHTNKFTINLPGDISSISTGFYWVYRNVSDTNCIHKSSISVPNLCFIDNANNKQVHQCDSLLEILTNKENIMYCIIIISVILIIFMILIIIIICKHLKLKKYKQQIEDYFSDFRQQKNSSMKLAHYPSVTGTDNINITINNNNIGNVVDHNRPTNNIYNRYSVTMNQLSPITFDIKSIASNHLNKQQNIIPENQSKSNEELSVSYSEDNKQNEIEFLKQNEIEFLKQNETEYSNELTKMANNQNKFGINNKARYNNVPCFENENNQRHRHQAFL